VDGALHRISNHCAHSERDRHLLSWQRTRMSPVEALKQSFTRSAVRRSLTVALLVGTALNLINQGDALFGAAPLVLWKLLLTYFVPFAVTSYGSYAALRSTR
jgi:hypothetical protein